MQDFGVLDLPYPLRKMSVIPLGVLKESIKDTDTAYSFARGIETFPTVGDHVLLPTQSQLKAIIESGDNRRVNIGISPLAGNAVVSVDPDRIFGRHLAVLGNTGSGKSCSVAGLLRWSIEAAKKHQDSPNTRFIVLDPNGEYTNSFKGLANVRVYGAEPDESQGIKQLVVPMWLWNNPNVFQICTLKHSDSNTAKRQEVGRGLRLCVNQDGNRMDVQNCGDSVHEINTLTVIASESYKTFVADLQSDIKTVLYDRPTVATSEYFKGKCVKVDDVPTLIDDEKANAIEFYLIQNGYVDMKRKVTDKYRQDIKNGTVAKLPEELKPMTDGIHTLIQAVYDDSVLKDMFSDGHETKVKDNPLNENFAKREFQALWREINHKYAYTVDFDSTELIRKAIAHIDEKLFVSELQYTTTIGRQKTEMNEYEIERGASFTGEKTRTKTLKHAETSQIKYDLIGKIAEGTVLTRRTVSAILQGIRVDKLYMFKNNPEEFITKVVRLINEQKATMIVEHISYDTIEGEYDSSIFTAEKATQSFDKAFLAKKAIQDYVFTDGSADKSIERKFAEDLDAADEVCVYAKLPRTFQIPTPVGNYSPDWAIAFYEGTVKHIFFIAETKGTMESLELRPIEQAKISCAKKLFNEMSTSNVVYHDVDSYQSLLNIMNSI